MSIALPIEDAEVVHGEGFGSLGSAVSSSGESPEARSVTTTEESGNALVGQGLCPCRSAWDAGASAAFDARCAACEAMPAARVRAEIGDAPLSGIEGRPAYRFAKRAFDVAFSLAVLVCLSWLFAIIAVKLDDSRGPMLFRQTSVAESGCEFTTLWPR